MPRLLAAVEEVLELASTWATARSAPIRGVKAHTEAAALLYGQRKASEDLARQLREAISRALLGEAGTDA